MCRTLTVVLVLAACLLASASSVSGATVHAAGKCSGHPIVRRLAGVAIVLSAKGMSCRRARKVVRAHGRDAGAHAYEKGGRFKLGKFRCRVYSEAHESNSARCHHSRRRFTVGYGT